MSDTPRKPSPQAYQALLDLETVPVPDSLRQCAPGKAGEESVPASRYLSREFHEREKRLLWPRVWQVVCRETEVDSPGDYCVHDVADFSILVVRTGGGDLHAYPNACLHRGRALKDGGPGQRCGRSGELRCPFHGFRWQLDGDFAGAPCLEDFPGISANEFGLPRLRVECWGGWVFVNRDQQAPALSDVLGVMGEHFQRWQPEKTCKVLHLTKVLRCNWKLAHEAFLESYHTVATHPQLLPYAGDAFSQYDCFNDYTSRSITPMGVTSPHLANITELQCAEHWLQEYAVEPDGPIDIPPDRRARDYLGDLNIRRFSQQYGFDLAGKATHSEVLDAILYSVFPNFAPWGGFRPNLTYRFLPWDDRPDRCTMEIMLLSRFDEAGGRPLDAAEVFVEADQSFAETDGIPDGLAKVFDQDFSNLAAVQKGLSSLVSGQIQLSQYQEVRVRHFHQTLSRFVQADAEEPSV